MVAFRGADKRRLESRERIDNFHGIVSHAIMKLVSRITASAGFEGVILAEFSPRFQARLESGPPFFQRFQCHSHAAVVG